MDSDDHPPPLRVSVTDERGRSLRRPGLARWLAGVAPARARGALSIALVSDAVMRRLNRQFARHDYATDVLSFPSEPDVLTGGPPVPQAFGPSATPDSGLRTPDFLGDLVIATGVAGRQAREMGHSLETELRVLALHGLLHLLGHDHAADAGEMARMERRLRRKGGLDEGLIDRAGGPARHPVGRASRSPAPASRTATPASRPSTTRLVGRASRPSQRKGGGR